MSGWEDDAVKESAEHFEEENGSRLSGYQYYTLIFGHPKFRRTYFNPLCTKKDAKGEPIVSRYWKASSGSERGKYMLEKCDAAHIDSSTSVSKRIVAEWKSEGEEYSAMAAEVKPLVNAIKKLLNESKSMVWWHSPAVGDPCQFGGPHLHVILESDQITHGVYQILHNQRNYRAIRDKTRATGGYARSEGVRRLDNLINHLNTPPRVFMGANNLELAQKWHRVARGGEGKENVPPGELTFTEDVDVVSTDGSGSPKSYAGDFGAQNNEAVATKRAADFGDEEPYPKQTRIDRVAAEFERKARADTHLYDLNAVMKETSAERQLRVIKAIILHTGETDFLKIQQAMTKEAPNNIYRLAWDKLQWRSTTKQYLRTAKDALRMEEYNLTMLELAERYVKQHGIQEQEEVMSVPKSVECWMAWCEYNCISPAELARMIQIIYDKKMPKMNALILQGPPNAGKTLFLHHSLYKLSMYSASINAAGNASEFCFQDMVGGRVAFFEEVQIDPNNIQIAKQLFEGNENTKVKQKHLAEADCGRIPIFATCNKVPWSMCMQEDQKAMEVRCVIYKCYPDEQLKAVVKKPNPGMWYFILKALNQLGADDELTMAHLDLLAWRFPEGDQPELDIE